MGALSVSQPFLGLKCILVNTFSSLDILYMYVHFRPMMAPNTTGIIKKNLKDLIDGFPIG